MTTPEDIQYKIGDIGEIMFDLESEIDLVNEEESLQKIYDKICKVERDVKKIHKMTIDASDEEYGETIDDLYEAQMEEN